MKVFSLKASGHYGGGMAIVAANDNLEAINLASHLKSYWRVDFRDGFTQVKELPVSYKGEAKVLEFYEIGE